MLLAAWYLANAIILQVVGFVWLCNNQTVIDNYLIGCASGTIAYAGMHRLSGELRHRRKIKQFEGTYDLEVEPGKSFSDKLNKE